MEDKFIKIEYIDFSQKLKIVYDKILDFKPNWVDITRNELYRMLINEINVLFPAVIEVTGLLHGNTRLESDFYDDFCKLIDSKSPILSDEHVKNIYYNVDKFIDLNNLRDDVRIYQNKNILSINYNKIKDRAQQSDDYLKRIIDVVKQAETLYTEHALKGFKTLYNGISESQKTFSKKWLIGSFVFGGLLLISILCCFLINSKIWNLIDYTNETNYIFIFANEISFNLVLLAAFFWCARMYSINKALEINYRHKSASSDALLSFVEAIKNDDKTKNSILLEAARMIFAPPETGLTSKGDKLNMKLLDTIRDISPVNNDNSKKQL